MAPHGNTSVANSSSLDGPGTEATHVGESNYNLTITSPSITLLQGIGVNSGVTPEDTFQTCVNFGANTIAASSDAPDKAFRLRARQNTTVRLPGYAGTSTTCP